VELGKRLAERLIPAVRGQGEVPASLRAVVKRLTDWR
jgi:hypothetical protein